MAKPYAQEMAKLNETLAWAAEVDAGSLCRAVATAGMGSLLAIGSGGSLSAAHAMSFLHRRATGQLAAIATPLEATAEPLRGHVATWLLSASGGNVDILAAFRALVGREGRQLAALCGRSESALGALAREHPFVDFLAFEPPAGRDGFLATNSLLAFTALLTRAYAEAFPEGQISWRDVLEHVSPLAVLGGAAQISWAEATCELWTRPTTLVLHGPATRLGAVDLESKFTESAIGNLQLTDWRNFAHGRHHWLAKKGDSSGIVAFVSSEDEALADRTLALIPNEIPVARLHFEGAASAASLASLVAALCITGWAGAARGIDPGRPGVPEFGRRLYNLALPRARGQRSITLTENDAAAITRKAGLTPDALAALGELDSWRTALATFRERLHGAVYAGVVLDYDGTVVDSRRRFFGPEAAMTDELARLVRSGMQLAVATGRGGSVRRDLQAALPPELWGQVLVGYYNGAEIAGLADDSAPDRDGALRDPLAALSHALREQPELAAAAIQTDRPLQITLEARRSLPEDRLWDLAQQVILSANIHEVTVTRSSHSIDIVPKGVSKQRVVECLHERCGGGNLLAIGDRGRWPGNDYDLLRAAFALSVDEVSVDRATCWHLGRSGQRGVHVTLEYLQHLQGSPGEVRFQP